MMYDDVGRRPRGTDLLSRVACSGWDNTFAGARMCPWAAPRRWVPVGGCGDGEGRSIGATREIRGRG